MFQPAILQPAPDPAFVRELRKIDPELRVIWGFERYLLNRWVIERKLSHERYFAAYASILERGGPRFLEQPVYDDDRPTYDEGGNHSGFEIVGYRRFDLAPDHEWVMTIKNDDDSFRPLDQRSIIAMRRAYAWDRFHSLTRLKLEKEREREEADAKAKAQRIDETMDELNEHRREILNLPFMGQVTKVLAGTELD